MQKPNKTRSKLNVLLLAMLSLATVLTIVMNSSRAKTAVKSFISATQAHLSGSVHGEYPAVDTTNLTPVQKNIIEITRREYALKPVSYDQNVLKYSQGIKEPWCADYATWVLKEAGAPLKNPNSGSWRIPGVLTLQEYYKSNNRYQKVGSYTPKTGDLAIYIGSRTLDGRSRQHTNIVLKVEGETMTTIGGNERGRMRISTQNYTSNQNSLVGFGVL